MLKTQTAYGGQGEPSLLTSWALRSLAKSLSLSLVSPEHLGRAATEGRLPCSANHQPAKATDCTVATAEHPRSVPEWSVPGIIVSSCLVSTSCCLHSMGPRPASLSCHPGWEAVLMSPAQLQVRVLEQFLHQFLLLGLFQDVPAG